jgi:transcriptional regulator with XRE-family HTH domain
MATQPASSPRVRALAARLRKLRTDRGLRVRELAAHAGIAHSLLSNWENVRRIPQVDDVEGLLDAMGVVGDERDETIDLARSAAGSNKLYSGVTGMSPALAGVLDCEATAIEICEWNLTVVPGLLQTADYARAILAASAPEGSVEPLVMIRLGRQAILSRTTPTEFTALVTEAALREPIGSPTVQADQLEHLLRIGQRENITIQVVRSGLGWHPGLAGSFIIYGFADSPPIIHIEHFSSSAFLYEAGDVAAFQAAAQELRGKAMSPEDSSELIAAVMEEMRMG